MTAQETQLIDLICPAIRNKNKIKFWYQDTTSDKIGWRTIEPHSIGQLRPKKPGGSETILLTGWFLPTQEQYYNGWEEKWGNYILALVSRVEILGEMFTVTRPGYNPSDEKRMSHVFCSTSLRVI